ncbi:uncharacterized protein MELLADRAFT_102653 [Melampsora larici-populina 98AG31]|uniref:Uncharacterized protein n=1 Tax=Melampsora larici-populina (strain 98AG31 / pathotype 3-4-7) TaxID=747676 RepID=F4R8Y7_MELLP|nr:uncharacterized protein MELLADRAFT_102653 [Melampsora larici-populina 98AG31]EGG10892.1 hypothetical protein MELLADRAFT_102653 [Melampsora larici-populina 98AG31]
MSNLVPDLQTPSIATPEALLESSLSSNALVEQGAICMNDLFEDPTHHLDGDESPAKPPNLSPLHRKGTNARKIFEAKHEVVIEVNFKIHVDQEVTVVIESSNTSSCKRKAATVNVIDSKVFNASGVRRLKQCLYGMSFKEFREICAGICEEYSTGMKQIVLSSEVAPNLIWKASVGGSKFELHNYTHWFEFVNFISQPKKCKGSLTIITRSAKAAAAQEAQVSTVRELIANTNGSMAKDIEMEAMSKELQFSCGQERSSHPALLGHPSPSGSNDAPSLVNDYENNAGTPQSDDIEIESHYKRSYIECPISGLLKIYTHECDPKLCAQLPCKTYVDFWFDIHAHHMKHKMK